jgi:hypothetical protein
MKTKLIVLFSFLSLSSIAQEAEKDSAFFSTKSKIELTEIYLNEVQRVVGKMGLFAFDSPGGYVPDSKYTSCKFKAVQSVEEKYNSALVKNYKEIIPYADTEQIVKAIIYLQSIK